MKTDNIEKMIISGLLRVKNFSNVALTFTKIDYFENIESRKIVEIILNYTNLYHKLPIKDSIEIELDKDKKMSSEEYENTIQLLNDVFAIEHGQDDLEYMLVECESYYRKRAVFNAIMDGINIIDGKDKRRNEEAIPSILQDALSVCFDMNVGHDYFEDVRQRHIVEEEEKIPFKLEILNTISNGGAPKKTLIVPLAVSGGGKSMFMSDWAAFLVKKGYNVIYFTMELAEDKIADRIDANMFDIPIQKIKEIDVDLFEDQVNTVKKKTNGRIFIKEFPSGAANTNDFRRVLNELKMKKNFEPDVIMVDYIGICSSSRMRAGEVNSYGLSKSIAEELRGIAQETNTLVVSPSQLNRMSYSSSHKNVGMENIADSIGIAFTADMMFSIFTNEELKEEGKVIFTQLKNRFGDPDKFKKFAVGQDSSRMKFYDLTNDEHNVEMFEKYKNEDEMLKQSISNAKTFATLPIMDNKFDFSA